MKIAIAGYGLEGESNYRYWSSIQGNNLTIVDQRQPDRAIPNGVQTIISDDAFDKLQGFDMVVRTAGLAPRKINTYGRVWSATNEFFDKCPAMIIGVTGSKGKGTTASLIASILRQAGKTVWLVGNIGKPGLDIISQIKPEDIVVYELSSFQLWDVQKSPHIAVILFIEAEHQDVHTSVYEYADAKSNITRYQGVDDILVYNKFNRYAQAIAAESKARTISYADEKTAHVVGDDFYYGSQLICPVSVLQITGKYNQDNACAAIDAVWGLTSDIGIIARGLHEFTGLPHRLQFIREVDGVKYYDDSIATTPGSAIAVLRAFDSPKVIILGGSSKGADFTELGQELTKYDVKAVIIGAEAENIAQACRQAGFNDFDILEGDVKMPYIVEKAKSKAVPGSVVLLCPAAASFGLFKNYVDRGDQFEAAVKAL